MEKNVTWRAGVRKVKGGDVALLTSHLIFWGKFGQNYFPTKIFVSLSVSKGSLIEDSVPFAF